MIDFIEAIKVLTNYAEFTIVDGDLDTIVFHTKVDKVPTLDEINAKVEELKAEATAKEATEATAKAALLARLGITADEAKLLLA